MSQNRALIVDDSRTAQARLKKMLERFDLEVDTVFSAEEAFGYLSYRHPAVVFLDHHMEGMDGLNALKVIKSNPDTALIPVIMYTSEQGDVYVGQARALGALDILSKEVMRHANLEQVLGSLGIAVLDAQGASATPAQERRKHSNADNDEGQLFVGRPAQEPSGPAPDEHPLDRVQEQINNLFEFHITKVRQEIEDNGQLVLHRLTKELQERDRAKTEAADDAPIDEPPPAATHSVGTGALLALVLVVLVFSGFHLYVNNQHQALASAQLDGLTERVRDQEVLINRLFAKISESTEAQQSARIFADKQVLLDAVGWAVNVNNTIPFAEIPLNNERVYILGEMLGLLNASNFEGTVYMDTHLGNYCVLPSPTGEWLLPAPDSSLDDCTMMATVVPEVPVNEQLTIAFLNYLNSAPILAEGKIEVEISTHNYSAPAFNYPVRTDTVTAGEWNAIAAKNSRVTVMFSAN